MHVRRYYAGIGSRETPPEIRLLMIAAAQKLCRQGWWLRSGGAEGADTAFEEGVDSVNPKQKEIWLPWDGFNGRYYEDGDGWQFRIGSDRDMDEAKAFHPAWHRLSQGGRKLQARNVAQILGGWVQPVPSPDDPDPDFGGGAYDAYRAGPTSLMVVCWTKDGKASGGTGQAIRIAQAHGVPVRNLYWRDTRDSILAWLKT